MIIEEDRTLGYFSFQVPLIDGENYNLMFFTALQEGLLIGSFNCNAYEKKQWQPIIKQLLSTLKEYE